MSVPSFVLAAARRPLPLTEPGSVKIFLPLNSRNRALIQGRTAVSPFKRVPRPRVLPNTATVMNPLSARLMTTYHSRCFSHVMRFYYRLWSRYQPLPGKTGRERGCYRLRRVGISAIQGARISGACPIIAIDVMDNKLELAKMRATHS